MFDFFCKKNKTNIKQNIKILNSPNKWFNLKVIIVKGLYDLWESGFSKK